MKLNEIEKTGAWSGISATLNNNFQRIENAVEALNYATRKNKGYFKSVDELRNTVPFANKGEIAYVGTTSLMQYMSGTDNGSIRVRFIRRP